MMGIHDGGRSVRVAVGLVQYQRDSDGDWWVAVGRRNGAIKWDALPASEHTRTLDELATLRAQLAGVREAAAPMLVSCENFHHEKKDRHGPFEECPVWARWNAALTAALEAS